MVPLDRSADPQLRPINEIKKRYEIGFSDYSLASFHPVTTEFDYLEEQINNFCEALIESGLNYIVIYPNNDLSDLILEAYNKVLSSNKFKIFPSIRFEYFLTLLKGLLL